MKLIILLAVVAWSNGAKLDRTYLPPNHAQTSGGSGNFLQTPVSGPSDYQNNDFSQANTAGNGFADTSFGQNYAQNGNNFAQNDVYSQNGFAQNDDAFTQGGNGLNNFEARPERAQAAFERNAAILRQDNTNDGETYAYAYETENGIYAEENGVATNGVEAQGGYSYTGDDGQVYSVRYTADQNGFVPQGDHLPTPPPIPEEILKALEQNARDEANGIYDDGSYSEGKYDNGNGQFNDESGYNYNNNGNNFNAGGAVNGDSFNGGNDDDSIVTNNALLRSGNEASGNGAFGNGALDNTASGFNNQNGVEKAYLPPFEQDGQRNQAGNAFNNQAGNGFNNQPQNNGFRNQGSNGVQKANLPPEQFGQRSQNGATNGRYNQRNGGSSNAGFRNQGSNGVEKAYLPPFAQNSVPSGRAYDQTQAFRSQGPRNNGFGSRNGANREYLPPRENQRTSGRRPGFSARNGYQY